MQTILADEKTKLDFAEVESTHTLPLYSFIGKSVVIFGDSNGLGTSLMKELVHQRAHLTLVVRTRGEQERARRELQDLTDQPLVILTCDTTDKEQMHNVVKDIQQTVGFIDVMINNLQKQSALNALCEILPVFCRQREGRIININSDFTDSILKMSLPLYNVQMTTILLSALVPLEMAAFEILKSVRKDKREIVISENSIAGHKRMASFEADRTKKAVLVH